MTEGPRAYSAYCQGEPRRAPQSSNEGLGTKKTLMVLVIVVGCFAVLWPKLFYPMLVNNNHIKPGPVDKSSGCCDVISELDVDTIKIMSELCGTIIESDGETPKEIVYQCRKAVLETCGIDISAALRGRISLGHSAKQILEEVRSLNGSLCLKYNFGVAPWKLGVPHRININLDPVNSIKQERSSQLRPGMVHPAFRERGRAIPETEGSVQPRRSVPPPRIVEGRPGPIPGMRPVMGGPGHVVAPAKQSNYGFMGVLMPIYTVGFVIFFSYTIMKLVFKKKPESHVGAPLYPPCDSDEQFHKEVFEANRYYFNRPHKDTSKIVVNAVAALLEEVNHEIEAHKPRTTPQADASNAQDEIKANGSLPKEEEQGSVTVMGMETTTSNESGKKWSRPDSPVLPHPPPPKEPSPPPQQIFLEGALPPQSQILVADSATEAQKDPEEDDSPVVLAGKMTLSVISLDSEDSSNSGRPAADTPDDERRRSSSSNLSDEFEKVNAADLEDQINHIIEQAETIALAEENRCSLDEMVPQINEKEREIDILEEIKNQFNLEDDLLQALKEREPESQVGMPVTDIIKELLNNEGSILLQGPPNVEPSEDLDLSDVLLRGLVVKEEPIEVNMVESFEPKKEEETTQPKELKEELIVLLNTTTQEDNKKEEDKEQQPNITDDDNNVTPPETTKEEIIVLLDTKEPITHEDSKEKEEELQSKEELIVLLTNDIVSTNEPKPTQVTKEEGEPQSKEEIIVLLDTKEHTTREDPKEKEEELIVLLTNDNVSTDEPKPDQVTKEEEEPQPKEEVIVLRDTKDHTTKEDPKEEGEPQSKEEVVILLNTNNEVSQQKEEQSQPKEEELIVLLSNDITDLNEIDKKEADDIAASEAGTSDITKIEEVVLDKEEPQPEQINLNENLMDVEEQVIEDILYEDEDDEQNEDRRVNGEDSSRNGTTGNSETAAENDISEDELENDEDEEIEEIIEYVDYTDEEGEEIIEINGNEQGHPH